MDELLKRAASNSPAKPPATPNRAAIKEITISHDHNHLNPVEVIGYEGEKLTWMAQNVERKARKLSSKPKKPDPGFDKRVVMRRQTSRRRVWARRRTGTIDARRG
jgi:hypothetical protein